MSYWETYKTIIYFIFKNYSLNYSYLFFTLICSLGLIEYSHAGTIKVPIDQASIQAGLDIASPGDTVLVYPGTYQEEINWPSIDGIKLLSFGDSSNTIIRGNLQNRVISNIESGSSDNRAVVSGFSITNGKGGISVGKNVIISDMSIYENGSSVSHQTELKGGGIYVYQRALNTVIQNSTIRNNYANAQGGGIYLNGALVENVVVENNKSIDLGGGIYITFESAKLYNSRIQNNYAKNSGGGIFLQNNPGSSRQSIDKCEILSNYIDNANGKGAGIAAIGAYADLININVSNNYFTSLAKETSLGGGIYLYNGISNLKSVVVENNTGAKNGGGVYLEYIYDQSEVIDLKVNNNISSSKGGGIYLTSFSATLDSSFIQKNKSALGGGLYINASNFSLQNSNIIANSSDDEGGGIFVENCENLSITENNISDNSSGSSGGGLYSVGSDPQISKTSFINNTAQFGGGIALGQDSYPSLKNCTLSNNFSVNDGDGIYTGATNSRPAISSSNICYNGVGLFSTNSSNFHYPQNNYWGDETGPYHSTENPGGLGDTLIGEIFPVPFLTDADLTAPIFPVQNLRISNSGSDFLELQWDLNQTQDVIGYTLYFDTDSSGYPYSDSIDVGNVTTYLLEGLSQNVSYYFSVTASDTANKESWYSVEIQGLISLTKIQNLDIGEEEDILHLTNHLPKTTFDYSNSSGAPQTHYQIHVSSDENFSIIDKWDSGVIESSSTSIDYTGNVLVDGNTYYLRAKVLGGNSWSVWDTITFHMNSVPSKPLAVSPNDTVISLPVTLSIVTSDAEDDNLSYNYFIYSDSNLSNQVASVAGHDSPNWEVNVSLDDNKYYWWTAEALDPYEKSSRSEAKRFYLNAVNIAPDTFNLIYPHNGQKNLPTKPTFTWHSSNDEDPNDLIYYNLSVGTDSILVNQIVLVDSISDTTYTLSKSLGDNSEYYWQVVAVDKGGLQSFTEIRNFYVNEANEAPLPFSLISPSQGQNSLPTTPTFIWESTTDNDLNDQVSYRLFISTDTTMRDIIRQLDTPDTNVTLSNSLADSLKYYWKVDAIDLDSLKTSSNIQSFVVGIISSIETLDVFPTKFKLSQNYPNPFNPSTIISFSIPTATSVELTIIDMLGKKVQTLFNGKLVAGNYEYEFDASNFASGIYLYMLKTKEFSQVKKMLLVK